MTDYLLPASFGALAATLVLITAWAVADNPQPAPVTCPMEVHPL